MAAIYELLNHLSENCAKADTELGEMASTWREETKSDEDFLAFSVDDLK